MKEQSVSDQTVEVEAKPNTSGWKSLEGSGAGGSYKVKRLDCDLGFSVVRSFTSVNDISSEFCDYEGHERLLVIAFGLSGKSEFLDKTGERLSFGVGQTTISIFREGQGRRIYAPGDPIDQLRLIVTESALIQYIGEERANKIFGSALGSSESFRKISMCNSCHSSHLHCIKNRNIEQEDGLTQRIHALSLLSEQLQGLHSTMQCPERLCARDLGTLDHIERFIDLNLDKPINNTFLCMRFGISEYKLKECFKQAHDTSPGRYLLIKRMHRAHELLLAGHRVSETAYKVGYQHPNNLTAAFVRFWGVSPKMIYESRSQ
ncbi:TPA: helix-turn-helix transcriptional regulator [Pseudomonas aeruginosa]|uniref:helix-turn-helix domain-containing protein n=1 Tax=Pseudomonas TaxID=286 RepID=UPI000F7F1784|nr:AraC family transcriptional regulator [Pseudomonas aeruginosa]HEK0639932.1 helix-turn-helix transcriptional regulator [Proteus mirabilis]MCO2889569.1 helix-turn-helix domain-containing protein [Pseudomonas aeruginosa]RTB44072.1 AraC family transcriptional regulator [Pseudomonas aeruginosa]RTB48993.1 AraC family transcriptional regulator [Pseudomonas aeruginosa]RTB87312.1 AraC family transcriptional regulator [Pseudomonas aeruginosa]